MISRYQVEEIQKIWDEQNKLNTWLTVEKLVVEAWVELDVIPVDAWNKIKTNAKINLNRMLELEKQTKHDVVAFTQMLSESLGEERKWIHFGLTSTDIVDTSQNYLIKQSNAIIFAKLMKLRQLLLNLAIQYKHQLIMGRTHGIYGEPTSLGLKFLLWYEELNRQINRLTQARSDIETVKISGSMGNYAHLELSIEEHVRVKLQLHPDHLSTQVTQRDRHAQLINCYANLASSFEKIATEIRLFQRSEVNELAEGFSNNQKGSSSMPHKKNPISSENISGLARMVKSYCSIGLENNVLWHERDISHSSNERIMLVDLFHLITYMTNRIIDVLSNLVVNIDQIEKHIKQTNGLHFSQVILNEIIKTNDVSREQAYDYVQKISLLTLNNHQTFHQNLINNDVEKYIPLEKLAKICVNEFFLRNVDKIYQRIIG